MRCWPRWTPAARPARRRRELVEADVGSAWTGLPEGSGSGRSARGTGCRTRATVVDTATKIEFIDRLADAGLPVIEATSFVRADRVPQLADAAEVHGRHHARPGVRYPVLVPNERGLEAALASDARDIAVFASATETFARAQPRTAR